MAYSQWWKTLCTGLTTASPRYIVPTSVFRNTEFATESHRQVPIGTPGQILTFKARLSGAPGAGSSYTFTLSLNSSPSASFVLTIGDASTTASVAGSLSLALGDALSIKKTVSGAPSAVDVELDLEFLPTTANYFCYFYNNLATPVFELAYDMQFEVTNGFYVGTWDTGQVDGTLGPQIIFPLAGTYRGVSVRGVTAPSHDAPSTGTAFSFTLNQNGALVGDAVTLSTNATGSVTGQTVPITAGDLLCLSSIKLSGSAFQPQIAFCVVIESTVAGAFAWIATCDQGSGDKNFFMALAGSRQTTRSLTEGDVQLHSPAAITFSSMFIWCQRAQAAGESCSLTFRKNGVDGNMAFTIAYPFGHGSDVAHSDALAEGDLIDVHYSSATGTPGTSWTISVGMAVTPSGVVGGGGGTFPLMSPFHPASLERFQRADAFAHTHERFGGGHEIFSPNRERF